MSLLCTSCGEEITLTPSAKDRARKFGGKPSDYTKLFTKHADCELADRDTAVRKLIREQTNAE